MSERKNNGRIKRVVLLCDFFSSLGGTEFYNYTLARELQRRGIEVRLYVGERPRLDHWQKLVKKLDLFLQYPEKLHEDLESNHIEIAFMNKIVYDINVWKPDIIHAHPFKKMAIQWFKHPDHDKSIPLVATEWTIANEKSKHWFDAEMNDYIGSASAYIATCQAVHDTVENVHGYAGPIVDIPHFVQSSNAINAPLSVMKNVAYIGRFSKEKGVNYLLWAWQTVIEEHPDATLTLYGHGDEEDSLVKQAQDLGISTSLVFAGTFAPINGINEISTKHQIFVQPSLFESIPTSLIELMLRGKTMIASDVGGVGELLSGTTGMLVEAEDVTHLSDAIIYALNHPEETLEKGKSASQLTNRTYQLDDSIDKLINLYSSLAEQAKT